MVMERCAPQSWKSVCHNPFPLSRVYLEDRDAATGGEHEAIALASPAVLTNGCNNITAILMAVVNTLSHNATTLIVGDGG